MIQHNSVPTTCTASLITGWSRQGLNDKDPKLKLRAQLGMVEDLRKGGFKRDFAILHAFTTQNQIDNYGLDEFMPKCGFERVYVGTKKDNDAHRHKETGDLALWATNPTKYEESLNAFHKELIELRDKIDPPKKPDPARQKFEAIKNLKVNKIVQQNAILDNPVGEVLLVSPEVARRHIKMKFGIDLYTWQNRGDAWLNLSLRQIRMEQERWKNELV